MKVNKIPLVPLVLLAGMLYFSLTPVHAADEFPYRKKYPNVAPISTQDLYNGYKAGDAAIVDVRSKLEYDVIHVDGASHIPLSNKTFLNQIGDLVSQNAEKKIAFYCNGITCLKSYEAAKRSTEKGFNNCYVYDAGIPDWAEVYPEETLLLGKVITDPDTQLIAKSEFQQKALPFDEFKAGYATDGGMLIDVRDHIQRSKSLPGLKKPRHIPLDRFLPHFVLKKQHPGQDPVHLRPGRQAGQMAAILPEGQWLREILFLEWRGVFGSCQAGIQIKKDGILCLRNSESGENFS